MFDKFGEFDSAEELNRAAAAQLAEGDTEAVLAIAEENGISKFDAQDYIDGVVPELATPRMAAIGKLELEHKEYEIAGILVDWETEIKKLCILEDEMSIAVRRKGKSLRDCMAAMIAFAFENKVQVSDKIVKATKVKHNGKLEPLRAPLYLGVPTRKEAEQIIREYYMGKQV
ncbi:MAG: hypothetical protein J6K15_06205 [Lachnospiraceae bacterium]|nr:hypothetical protein [Lachnospiraceae bacterium]